MALPQDGGQTVKGVCDEASGPPLAESCSFCSLTSILASLVWDMMGFVAVGYLRAVFLRLVLPVTACQAWDGGGRDFFLPQ